MPDKLTDAEVKKALTKVLYGGHGCKNCKYDNGKGDDRCGLKGCKIARYALDLINRQEEEDESLKAENSNLTSHLTSLQNDLTSAKAEVKNWQGGYMTQKQEIANLEIELKAMRGAANSYKAEVERLKNAYKQCAWERDIFAEDMTQEIKKDCSYLMLDIKTIKAEAYKEFADNIERAFSKTESQMPNSEVIKQTVQICRNAIRIALNELVGDTSAGKNK